MKILFVGSNKIGHACCEALIRTGVEVAAVLTMQQKFDISYAKEKGVTNVLHADFHVFENQYGIPVHGTNGRLQEYMELLNNIHFDLMVVIGWYHMIPAKVRNLASKGCVGIHASLLPKYRGGAPLVWAVINGERESGVTLFHMEDGVDDGDVVGQEAFEIGADEYIRDVLAKAEQASVRLVEKYVPRILAGDAPRIPQDPAAATVYPQRKPEDGQIDWSWDAEKIFNFIRAQSKPYPGAFTFVEGKKVTIWQADVS
ncbi:MAG: methionyl-tRNA formyltransferase [Flavobacteriales bacterium]|nr:methionyl-tRNA formyltransferase [Flavobacteriales bacterium]MCB9447533.1 methionyl-tRNA formyltransferase [Flavobacteriales bacterium]